MPTLKELIDMNKALPVGDKKEDLVMTIDAGELEVIYRFKDQDPIERMTILKGLHEGAGGALFDLGIARVSQS